MFSWADATSTKMNPSGYSLRLRITHLTICNWDKYFLNLDRYILQFDPSGYPFCLRFTLIHNQRSIIQYPQKKLRTQKPEDHGACVHHGAEDPVPCCRPNVVVERTTWLLDGDQRAKAVRVVSRCHLQIWIEFFYCTKITFKWFRSCSFSATLFAFSKSQGFLNLISAFFLPWPWWCRCEGGRCQNILFLRSLAWSSSCSKTPVLL